MSHSKPQLVRKLEEDRAALLAAIDGLNEEQITRIPIVGEWTIKDLFGHIAYWEGVILDHVRQSFTEGRPRPVLEDEMDASVNPRQTAKRKHRSWPRVKAEFENVRQALIRKVDSLSENELAFQVPNPWWNEQRFYSVGQMIEEDALGHGHEHAEQIRRWRKQEKAAV